MRGMLEISDRRNVLKEKSLNINLILNSVKVTMSIIFPLITFPYVTRILSPTDIGEYDYANSIINYFVLIAGLGVSTYAIRSGANIRDKKEKFEKFAGEVFSLNILSTIVSYLILVICLISFNVLYNYRVSICLFSILIIFKTIGVEWVFNIYEDYKYITIRSILFQIISVILLFSFVRDENDLYIYIVINVISNVGSNICNFFYAKRYCNLKIIFSRKLFTHLKPVVVIFSTTLATMIYVNSDTTMLGILCGTEQVGYYAVACKMYNCIKAMLNGMVPVFMARLAYQYKEQRKEYDRTFRYAFDLITCITIPLGIGALFYSKEIILILSGEEYLAAEDAMKFLFFSLLFATLGNLYSSGGLLQAGKEKTMLIATGCGAVFNIITNYIAIPFAKCTGAAATTLMTEVIIFFILFLNFQKNISTKVGCEHIVKCFFATIPFWFIKKVTVYMGFTDLMFQLLGIVACIFIYFVMLLVMRDELVIGFWKMCKIKIIKKKVF